MARQANLVRQRDYIEPDNPNMRVHPRADMDASDDDRSKMDEFVQLLTKAQFGLLRYITGLVGNPDTASNILQNTNLLLWQKAHEFEMGTNFEAWATKTAYWQVRAFYRDCERDRHVFSEQLALQLAEQATDADEADLTMHLLRDCVVDLRDKERQLVNLRYGSGLSVQQLSTHLKMSPSAIKAALLRVRRVLRKCVESKLKKLR